MIDEPLSSILSKCPQGAQNVQASTQYGMGLIITDDNEIVFRDDEMSHDARRALAQEINSHLPQRLNAQ